MNRWNIPFKNGSGEEIPPFAVMRITGIEIFDGRSVVMVDKPNTYGSQYLHYINGPIAVADGKCSTCTNAFPALAKYNTGSSPTVGKLWGPRNGSWELQEETGGFIVIGVSATTGLAVVGQSPMLAFTGRFDSDVSQGSTATVSVYWQGVDTGENISGVYAISGDFTTSDDVNASLLNERWEAYCRVPL